MLLRQIQSSIVILKLVLFRKGLTFGATMFVMLSVCYGSFCFLEFILHKGYRTLMTISLVAITELLPILTRLLTNFERHYTTSSYETSYLFKSVPSHWFTACFIPWYISDFTEHNDTHVFYHIIDVLLLHSVSKPLLHMIDPIGLVKRNIVARFAKTDRAVKALYVGKRWTLSKRYVDITTNVMICFIYGSVMPLIYFILALTCFMTYWADKYCLFRVNAELPPTDEHLGMLVYVYLCIAVAIHMLFTLWFFGSWPFDQVCPTKKALNEEGLEIANTYGLAKDSSWEACNQNFFRIGNFHLGEHLWWKKSQKKFISLYVWVVAGAAITWLVWFFSMRYLAYRVRLEKLKEKVSDGKFSMSLDDLPDNKTREYVPHLNIPGEDLPVQAAFDVGSISSDMNDRRLPFLQKVKAGKNLFYDSSLQSIDTASRQRIFSRIMITDMDKKQNMRQRKISSWEEANESDGGRSEESKMEIETDNPMLQKSGISGTQSLSVDPIYRNFGVDRHMWNGL